MVDEKLRSRNDGLQDPHYNPRSRNYHHVKLMDAHDADIIYSPGCSNGSKNALQPLGDHGYFYHVGAHLSDRVYPRRQGCSSRQPSSSGVCSFFFKPVGAVVRTGEVCVWMGKSGALRCC